MDGGLCRLDLDSNAFVAHLGPADPKPWTLWRWDRLMYLAPVVQLIEWGEARGYHLTSALDVSLKPLSVSTAGVYHAYRTLRSILGGAFRGFSKACRGCATWRSCGSCPVPASRSVREEEAKRHARSVFPLG